MAPATAASSSPEASRKPSSSHDMAAKRCTECLSVFGPRPDPRPVGGSALPRTADPDVDALGVLTKNHEIHVFCAAAAKRHDAVGERPNRPDVGVQIEAEAHPEQNRA